MAELLSNVGIFFNASNLIQAMLDPFGYELYAWRRLIWQFIFKWSIQEAVVVIETTPLVDILAKYLCWVYMECFEYLFTSLHHDCLVRKRKKKPNIIVNNWEFYQFFHVNHIHPDRDVAPVTSSDQVKIFSISLISQCKLPISHLHRMHRHDANTLDTLQMWPMSFDCLWWIVYRSPCTDNEYEKWCLCLTFLRVLFDIVGRSRRANIVLCVVWLVSTSLTPLIRFDWLVFLTKVEQTLSKDIAAQCMPQVTTPITWINDR